MGMGGWSLVVVALFASYTFGYSNGHAGAGPAPAFTSTSNVIGALALDNDANPVAADNMTTADAGATPPAPQPSASDTPDDSTMDGDYEPQPVASVSDRSSAPSVNDDSGAAASPSGSYSTALEPSGAYSGYVAPSAAASPSSTPLAASGCSESGSCYGDISTTTGLPKTTYVNGYYRRNGTYVRSYFRSHR
jgi:hypothetical protein